jgi:hypothetical protein
MVSSSDSLLTTLVVMTWAVTKRFIAGSFLQVATGYRTTCGIRDSDDDAPIHCWGARANELLNHIKSDTKTANDSAKSRRYQVSLGKDHACVVSTVDSDSEESASSTSFQCWWLGGSNYDAHKVPPMLEVVVWCLKPLNMCCTVMPFEAGDEIFHRKLYEQIGHKNLQATCRYCYERC